MARNPPVIGKAGMPDHPSGLRCNRSQRGAKAPNAEARQCHSLEPALAWRAAASPVSSPHSVHPLARTNEDWAACAWCAGSQGRTCEADAREGTPQPDGRTTL
jgi:hypothetical protein